MLFNPDECSWCGADLVRVYEPTKSMAELLARMQVLCDINRTATFQPTGIGFQPAMVYCSDRMVCCWREGEPARYESELGWKAMEDCWRD